MNRYLLRLFDLIKGHHTLAYLNEFEKTLHFSKDDLSNYQYQKTQKLLLHAAQHVPFYRKIFQEAGFDPQSMRHLDEMNKIPVLTREDLQNHWSEIVSEKHRKTDLSKGSSSGSTGLPVFYYKDKLAVSAGHAAHLLGWSFATWEMKSKGLHIWGNPSTVNNEWNRWSSKMKARLFNHHKFPAYTLTHGENFRKLYTLIKKEKYDYIDGYTNAIFLFADYMKQHNLQFRHTIKQVLTTAENLQDYQRQLIEEQIAPVYDEYGCGEINGIAYQCEECQEYHVIDPHVYLEFGEPSGANAARELVITDLDNYAFPLIRYKNDDMAVPSENNTSCSIPFSSIKSVAGRQSDVIRLKDGGTLSVPSFFGSMLLKQVKGIKQYQIERVKEDLIYVNFVKSADFTGKDHDLLASALDEYLLNRINYEIHYLEEIKPAPTGKYKLLIDKTKK